VDSNERGFSESASLRPSSGLLFPLEAFVVFVSRKSQTCREVGTENYGFLRDVRVPKNKPYAIFLFKIGVKKCAKK